MIELIQQRGITLKIVDLFQAKEIIKILFEAKYGLYKERGLDLRGMLQSFLNVLRAIFILCVMVEATTGSIIHPTQIAMQKKNIPCTSRRTPMPEIIYGKQGDKAWEQNRIGSIGASRIKDLMAKGQGKSRKTLLYQLAGEILSGEKYQIRQTPEMARGLIFESDARSTFGFITELDVEEISLIKRTNHIHCSPDGLTSDGGGLEIKCPLAHTQCKYIIENRLPLEYVSQVQYSLFVTGYLHWWFFSYHPKIKPLLLKIKPDEKYIADLQVELIKFLRELDDLVEKIK